MTPTAEVPQGSAASFLQRTRIIDLTALISEQSGLNHPNHPRAPVIWQYQRHAFSQWLFAGRWKPPDIPPLYDGLPPEAGMYGKGHGVQSEQAIIGTHMGTHLDSPVHFDNRSEDDISKIALDRCWGEAIMLDLRAACATKRSFSAADLDAAERASGHTIQPGHVVILHTGHSARFGYGPEASQDQWAAQTGMDYEAPQWFLKREVKLVGIDSPSIDCDVVAVGHVNFLLRPWIGKPAILIVENLVNLEHVPTSRFFFIAFPLPIQGGSGSPIRAVALV